MNGAVPRVLQKTVGWNKFRLYTKSKVLFKTVTINFRWSLKKILQISILLKQFLTLFVNGLNQGLFLLRKKNQYRIVNYVHSRFS